AALAPEDRVQLSAVDLQYIPLTEGFVAAGSKPLQDALAQLRRRVPLGSTDMQGVLESACQSFGTPAAGRGRSIVYLGDGMSMAQVVGTDGMTQLVNHLVAARVAVNSYAIGPRYDAVLLGALASNTGGLLAIDREDRVDANGK